MRMKKNVIKRNRHRPTPFRIAAFNPIFRFNKNYFDREFTQYVRFNSSCQYLIGINQADWNKLMGVCLSIFGPHDTSYRFAWRWCEDKRRIEICAYYYCNGKGWIAEHLGYMYPPLIYKVSLKLKARDGKITAVFSMIDVNARQPHQVTVHNVLNSSPRLGFGCGLYFGGNRKAPHDIEIYTSDIEVK